MAILPYPHRLRIVVVDDHQSSIDVITAHATKMESVSVSLATTDPFEALRFIRQNTVEAVFLDVRMDVMDGLEFIEQLADPPPIVLTTAYDEFALKGYELEVVDYLLKPIDFAQFAKAIHRVEKKLFGVAAPTVPIEERADSRVILPVEHKMVMVNLTDILALAARRNTTEVHVLGQYHFLDRHTSKVSREVMDMVVNRPFGELVDSLPYPQFVRTHRSYAVALDMIAEFNGGFVKLFHLPQKSFSVSETYREEIKNLLSKENQ